MLEMLSGLIIQLIASSGYLGIFVLMAIGASVFPIPSEIVLPFSGFLVHSDKLNFVLIVLTAVLADTTGSLILYGLGYFLEENVILNLIKKHGKYILVSENEYEHAAKWFGKYGDKMVFFGKMIPGVHWLISLPAGVFEMKPWKFIAYCAGGSIVWSALLTYVGVYLGSKWQSLSIYFRQFEYVILALLVIVVIWYLNHKLHFLKKVLNK